MDAELFIGLIQEQMSRMSPAELAKIQKKMMSDPEFFELVREGMESMNPGDLTLFVEIMKNVLPEEMAHAGEKMAKEIASMCALADGAELLKKQGNQLHSRGKYQDAAQKYLRAKNNLKEVPAAKGRALQLTCSLNLMSCYLNTQQFHDCIKEGYEVLAYDEKNVKALYRRGQAYKELGQLENAVSDLRKVHEVFPDAKTVAEFLRAANESPGKGGVTRTSTAANDKGKSLDCSVTQSEESSRNSKDQTESVSKRPTTESECLHALKDDPDTIREGNESLRKGVVTRTSTAAKDKREPLDCSVTQSEENNMNSKDQTESVSKRPTTESECLHALKDDPDTIRSFQSFISQADPEVLARMGSGKSGELPADMLKTASSMIGRTSPEEVQNTVKMAALFQGGSSSFNSSPFDANLGSGSVPANLSPEMLKTAGDIMGKMSPEEHQRMLEMAASLKQDSFPSSSSSSSGGLGSSQSNLTQNQDLLGDGTNFISFQRGSSPFNGSPFAAHLGSGSVPLNLSPEMLKTAGDMMGNMSPEERQRMFEMAACLKQDLVPSSSGLSSGGLGSSRSNLTQNRDLLDNGTNFISECSNSYGSSSGSTSQTSFPTSMGDMQEQMRNQMKDPATRQIFSSMLKNMSPDMMASMREQFGLNLSKEDAAKAQAMASLSPKALDKMMRWADRFQRVVEGAKKTKNWLPRRRGMVLILCMLILAIIIHFYGFVGSRAIHNLDKNPKSNPIQSELLIRIGFFRIWIGFGFNNFEN